jgi:hypothetical protein
MCGRGKPTRPVCAEQVSTGCRGLLDRRGILARKGQEACRGRMGLISSPAQVASRPVPSPCLCVAAVVLGHGRRGQSDARAKWLLRVLARTITRPCSLALPERKTPLTHCAGGLSPSTETRLINCNSLGCRVEIKHLGEWGTVCGNGFSAADARVTCRAMGFTGGQIRCA